MHAEMHSTASMRIYIDVFTRCIEQTGPPAFHAIVAIYKSVAALYFDSATPRALPGSEQSTRAGKEKARRNFLRACCCALVVVPPRATD